MSFWLIVILEIPHCLPVATIIAFLRTRKNFLFVDGNELNSASVVAEDPHWEKMLW